MKYVGLLVVVVIILGGVYMLLGGENAEESSTLDLGLDTIERAEQIKDRIEARNEEQADELGQEGDGKALGVREYDIGTGSFVLYTVRKEFFSEPVQTVTGRSEQVSGTFMLDTEANAFSVDATTDPQTLLSGNADRDAYAHSQFTGDITIVVNDYVLVDGLGAVAALIPVELTINGITRTVSFEVAGAVSEDVVQAEGSASINMTDFNIEPASIAGVYELNEIANISFTVFAE